MFYTCIADVQAQTLKITTWNLDWLVTDTTHNAFLPVDIPHRTPHDFARLRHYAEKLNSDIIAFQEVDTLDAAERVFDPSHYHILMTDDQIPQHVGLAFRHSLRATLNPELTALDVSRPGAHHALRGGLDVTLHIGQHAIRILVVHLKTGCWARSLNEHGHSCPTLYQQFHVIENWILDREDDGIPFIILGDFNRRLTSSDPVMTTIINDSPLTLTTAGYASPCRGGEKFIDHILLGNQAEHWLVPDSLRVMIYRDDASSSGLSDHCPVSVMLHLPS